jgi:hypothetical protein
MAEARVERRLAAILAADVVGYSRLMGVDEEGTLAALKASRREIIDPEIAEHRGRIVKTTARPKSPLASQRNFSRNSRWRGNAGSEHTTCPVHETGEFRRGPWFEFAIFVAGRPMPQTRICPSTCSSE